MASHLDGLGRTKGLTEFILQVPEVNNSQKLTSPPIPMHFHLSTRSMPETMKLGSDQVTKSVWVVQRGSIPHFLCTHISNEVRKVR